MTRDELAAALNGKEYPLHHNVGRLFEQAKENGLVVIYGASDDLMELDGAIRDEADCYGGGKFQIDSEGPLPSRDSIEDDDELERFFARRKTAASIKAIWGKGDISWTYETAIPHSTFDVMEEGEVYCRGLVISLADLPAALARGESQP